jgi:hypothetical protein
MRVVMGLNSRTVVENISLYFTKIKPISVLSKLRITSETAQFDSKILKVFEPKGLRW